MKRSLLASGVLLALGAAAAAEVPYRLGRETVPNGSFDHVGPKWQQLRPDEGEKLAIIPEGWFVGYQGGQRTMPLAGKDPDTGGRCMDFLYGAGRVDLHSPIFPLDGAGTYLLSMRTRSVVGPTDHALRVVVRLLGPESDASAAPPLPFETRVAAGPPERKWAAHTALVAIGGEATRAEIHLVKDDDRADFLVDDVSFRRIEAAPQETRFSLDPQNPPWESPVLFLGAIEGVDLSLEGSFPQEIWVEARTGTTPTPDAAWESWRRAWIDDSIKSSATGGFHILATGIDLFAQVRFRGFGVTGLSVRTRPASAPSRGVLIEEIDDPEQPPPVEVSGIAIDFVAALRPPAWNECVSGALAPLRSRALASTRFATSDRARAIAIRDAAASWLTFTAGGDPPEGSGMPDPGHLLADCASATPLHCRGRAREIVTGACRCLGMICTGEPEAGTFDVWLDDERRWIALALDPNAVVLGESSRPAISLVHADFAAAGPRALKVNLYQTMPDFDRYMHRFTPAAPWTPVEGDLVWRLAPGDNSVEIAARNHAGKLGPVAAYRARVEPPPAERAAPYAGLRALSGDPHVHTGLALYPMLNPKEPLATGTPEAAFDSARKNGLDWAAVTDYSANIDDPRARKGTTSEWDHLRDAVTRANEPGRFAAFLGVEFDGGGFTTKGGTGRKLILLPDASADTYCSPMTQNVGDCPVVEDAYRYARAHGGAVIAATPCAAAGEDTDWSRFDPILSLMEMVGGACETGPGGLLDVASRRALPVGAAGGGNSRKATAGETDRTICWAKDVTRESLIDAMRARRCYFSAAGHMELAFSIDGAPMGAEIEAASPTAWSVTARSVSAPAFSRIEILRDGAVVASAPCESATRCDLEGGLGAAWPGLWYAAVDGADGARLAISSPVRVGGGEASR
ncbi:MAG: hypothetical protein HY049_05315 [Acidobacteria bacterium]|nr:hypothetical protein [Acidobacteriota bacterium]